MNADFDELISRKGTQCIKYDAVARFLGSDDLIPMWVADMDFRTPSFIMDALNTRLKHEILGYSLRSDGYFDSIKGWLSRKHQWSIDRTWITFCPGVVPAINMAVLAFTEVGDSVITQPPVYFPFFSAVKDHDRNLVYNPLILKDNRLSVDFDDLEKKAAAGAKMIIISNPHNPGGSVWTKEELIRLAEICLRHNVLMLSDEIHCDLVYKPNKHTPLASLSDEIAAQTITTVAPSKTFNLSGLSTSSVIISNPELRKKFTRVIDGLHLDGGNIAGNIASEAAYTYGDEWQEALMDYLAGNLDYMQSFLETRLPKIRMIRPEATFLVWLDCRAMGMDDKALNEFFLYKAKLGLNPGVMFGPGGDGFMRLNIGCPLSVIKQAMEQLEEAVSAI